MTRKPRLIARPASLDAIESRCWRAFASNSSVRRDSSASETFRRRSRSSRSAFSASSSFDIGPVLRAVRPCSPTPAGPVHPEGWRSRGELDEIARFLRRPHHRNAAKTCQRSQVRLAGRRRSARLATRVSGEAQGTAAMSDTTITDLRGRRVWDSRGRPTIEAEVRLADGSLGRAIAPAGASTGSGEAVDLRDGGPALRRSRRAARARPCRAARSPTGCAGQDAADQAAVDAALVALDGTAERSRLGGNALVAVSHGGAQGGGRERRRAALAPPRERTAGDACRSRRSRFSAAARMRPGGSTCRTSWSRARSAGSFAEALDRTAEVYRAAGAILKARGKLQGVADEGGHWPAFESNEEALDALVLAIEKAGLHGRRGRGDLARRRRLGVRLGRALPAVARRPRARHATAWRRCWSAGAPAFRSSRSRIRWRRTTRPASGPSRRRWATACRWSATISSSRMPRGSGRRRRRAPAPRC